MNKEQFVMLFIVLNFILALVTALGVTIYILTRKDKPFCEFWRHLKKNARMG